MNELFYRMYTVLQLAHSELRKATEENTIVRRVRDNGTGKQALRLDTETKTRCKSNRGQSGNNAQ